MYFEDAIAAARRAGISEDLMASFVNTLNIKEMYLDPDNALKLTIDMFTKGDFDSVPGVG